MAERGLYTQRKEASPEGRPAHIFEGGRARLVENPEARSVKWPREKSSAVARRLHKHRTITHPLYLASS